MLQDEGDLPDEYDGGSVPPGYVRVLPRHPKIRDPFEPRSAPARCRPCYRAPVTTRPCFPCA